jgi:hypothetical protein
MNGACNDRTRCTSPPVRTLVGDSMAPSRTRWRPLQITQIIAICRIDMPLGLSNKHVESPRRHYGGFGSTGSRVAGGPVLPCRVLVLGRHQPADCLRAALGVLRLDGSPLGRLLDGRAIPLIIRPAYRLPWVIAQDAGASPPVASQAISDPISNRLRLWVPEREKRGTPVLPGCSAGSCRRFDRPGNTRL